MFLWDIGLVGGLYPWAEHSSCGSMVPTYKKNTPVTHTPLLSTSLSLSVCVRACVCVCVRAHVCANAWAVSLPTAMTFIPQIIWRLNLTHTPTPPSNAYKACIASYFSLFSIARGSLLLHLNSCLAPWQRVNHSHLQTPLCSACVCMCVCVRACVCVRVCACACVCVCGYTLSSGGLMCHHLCSKVIPISVFKGGRAITM